MSWGIKETIGREEKASVGGRKKNGQTTTKKTSSWVKKASATMITEIMIMKTVNGSKAEVNRKKAIIILRKNLNDSTGENLWNLEEKAINVKERRKSKNEIGVKKAIKATEFSTKKINSIT